MNDYKLNRTCTRLLTENEAKSIERRQNLAIILNAKEKIEDYKNEVFGIIDEKGLKNEDNKTSLDTALKVLEYIIPKKKSSEVILTHKTIENIIMEHVEDAKIVNGNDIISPSSKP